MNMFIEIFVEHIDRGDLGWIISKHPNNSYKREIKKGRLADGSWIPQGSTPDGWVGYRLMIKNDPLIFLEKSKAANSANYVDVALAAVCPYNLKIVREVFSSTLSCKYDNECKKWSECLHIKLVLGPFPGDLATRLSEFFYPLSIQVSPHKTWRRTFEFESTKNSRLDEFLQKIYVGTYLLTKRFGSEEDSQRQTLKNLSANWFSSAPERLQRTLGYLPRHDFLPSLTTTTTTTATSSTTTITTSFPDTTTMLQPRADEDDSDENNNDEKDDKNEQEIPNPEIPSTSTRDLESLVFVGENLRLHDVRHNLILELLKSIIDTQRKDISVLDFGCAKGELTQKVAEAFPNIHITCIDADPFVLKNKSLQKLPRVKIIVCNMLYPPDPAKFKSEIMLFTEVIEHFWPEERRKLMNLISQYLRPKYLILTTPNIEYNSQIPNLINGFRHPDHKVEFTSDQLKKEILDVLSSAGYECTLVPLLKNMSVQPSFVVSAKLVNDESVNKSLRQQLKAECEALNKSLWLPRNQYMVDRPKMKVGLASYYFLQSCGKSFYLGPTVPPVDTDPTLLPLALEHPEMAFRYYTSVGLSHVTCEYKYMGSRAHVLAFRSTTVCPPWRDMISVKTRNGIDFFKDKNNPLLLQLQSELSKCLENIGYDFVVLDCEFLPWSLKAASLIDLLQSPGECAEVSREYCYGKESPEYQNAKNFVTALSHYVKQTPPELRVFQVLAAGKVAKDELIVRKMGAYMRVEERYELIKKFESPLVKCVEYTIVSLNSESEKAKAISAWESYCKQGGEGWVIKSYPFHFCEESSGHLVLPMLKVRGIDYLRLVYGIDYLEANYFRKLLDRSTSSKRQLAKKQEELADGVLKSFLRGYPQQMMIYSAAFFGVDYQKINATL